MSIKMKNTELQTILESILYDDIYSIGAAWGKPRAGHPEATVAEHIKELESNLEKIKWRLEEEQILKLRILIHVHDVLKIHAAPRVPIEHPHSHASLAADFLANFTNDEDLINMVRYHDESYALYRHFEIKKEFDTARLKRLADRIIDWDLFLVFNIIDNCTEGKGREPLRWFFNEIRKLITTKVDESWIL